MKQIIIVESGSVSATDKDILRKEGIIIIEHKNPQSVRVINNIDGFEGDDIFQFALASIYSEGQQSKFGGLLIDHLKSRSIKKTTL